MSGSGEAVVRHCLMIFKDKLSQEEIMSMSSIQEESRENGHLFYLWECHIILCCYYYHIAVLPKWVYSPLLCSQKLLFNVSFWLRTDGYALDILFRQITLFIKVRVAFIFGLQTIWLIDFTKFYELKGKKSQNNGHTNFYEHCNLMKKYF